MERARFGTATLLLLLSVPPAGSKEDAQTPTQEELLRRAGALTVTLEDRLAVIVAREEYLQGRLLDRDSVARVRRKIVSDVVWVRTGDAMVWAFFRDVVSVDGTAVVDRANRLEELFSAGATADARRQAAQLLEESARYNLGRRRTVNTPVFGLSILHPRNQPRFRFTSVGVERIDATQAQKLRFSETGSPTLTRTSQGIDVPARGTLWIEPAQGALVASELHLDAPGLPAEIKVRFRREAHVDAWVPLEMNETYGNRSRTVGEERLEATAKYSNFRRAEVEVLDIVPIR
jgi:hypothetical protein